MRTIVDTLNSVFKETGVDSLTSLNFNNTKKWQSLLSLTFLSILVSWPAFSAEKVTLRLLVWEGYAPTEQRQEFIRYINAKYDVELSLSVKYIAEAEDGFEALRLKKADVISPAHNRINDKRFRMIDSGLLLPLDLNNIPNYTALSPSFKKLDHLVKEGVHYGLPFGWGPYGLAYNTEKFETPPSTWSALWQSQHQGKYSIADYGEINIYLVALAMGYGPQALNDFDKLNNPEFKARLLELVSGAKSLWVGVDTAADLKGMSIASSWGFALPKLKQLGEEWKWAYPKNGVPGWIDNHVLSSELANKPVLKRIAEEWLNYTISFTFQDKVLVKSLSTNPVNSLTFSSASAEEKQGFYAESLNDPKALIILMPELDRRTRNGMNNLWNEALATSRAVTKVGQN